jgi:hypothetical protein
MERRERKGKEEAILKDLSQLPEETDHQNEC